MTNSNIFDAIVVGSGISGGWAAKELTEKGLKTILLERGRNVEHIKDYEGTEKILGNYNTAMQKLRKIKPTLLSKVNATHTMKYQKILCKRS